MVLKKSHKRALQGVGSEDDIKVEQEFITYLRE
jgi:hypothetical protein